MAGVLTVSSNVTCGHAPGKVSTNSSAKLTVNGSPVLLKNSIDMQAVAGCSTVPKSASGDPVDAPCLLVTSTPLIPPGPPTSGVTAGEASKLTAGGAAVVLDTLAGKTNGMIAHVSPQSSLSATAVQNKLTAV